MAPVRRYLRITAKSVLEVRIYLDNPADAYRWLLRPQNPALPRIIEAVRPLVLPKLREENENARKSGKRKGIKDVVVHDDFEVSIFLTDISEPHSILTRQKHFLQKTDNRTAGTQNQPLDVDDEGEVVRIRRESSEDGKIDLDQIPLAGEQGRTEEDAVSVSDSTEEETTARPRRGSKAGSDTDDKKKMGLTTSYDGFQIYGRILCLIVTRKGGPKTAQGTTGGQAMMEEWISSTQDGAGAIVEN